MGPLLNCANPLLFNKATLIQKFQLSGISHDKQTYIYLVCLIV